MMSSTLTASARALGRNGAARMSARAFSSAQAEEIKMLEKLLAEARGREGADESKSAAAAASAGPKFNIGTFNAISPEGLARFPPSMYDHMAMGSDDAANEEIHAVLLRSQKIGSADIPDTVRAIARCGSGTNNIDVEAMTERGIPVFNTPGANANAVKELAVCGILLASRGIVEGISHVHKIVEEEGLDEFPKIKKRVETDKKMFVGREVAGKKLGIVGLGHIGASVAQTGIALGMDVMGYDPAISLDAAWRLPGHVLERASSITELCEQCDYISLHVPYMKETHHLISADILKKMKPTCHIVNFARGELVDTAAMRSLYDSGDRTGRYIADFADEFLHDHPKVVLMPHLGASTAEAEENAASMAAAEIIDFIETGTVINSVNFPTTKLDAVNAESRRICIVNKNVPGMLGLITSTLGGSNINIIQQINTSRGNLAYNVIDVADTVSDDELVALQADIAKLDGVLSSRVISSGNAKPGMFSVNK
mmetsp:Transcript_10570/g.18715  ORF Transcript_10570/g.18715 Transcript_10570/m.18715 type:complete len:485 (-) Transcript_10570:29-1483(-)